MIQLNLPSNVQGLSYDDAAIQFKKDLYIITLTKCENHFWEIIKKIGSLTAKLTNRNINYKTVRSYKVS